MKLAVGYCLLGGPWLSGNHSNPHIPNVSWKFISTLASTIVSPYQLAPFPSLPFDILSYIKNNLYVKRFNRKLYFPGSRLMIPVRELTSDIFHFGQKLLRNTVGQQQWPYKVRCSLIY